MLIVRVRSAPLRLADIAISGAAQSPPHLPCLSDVTVEKPGPAIPSSVRSRFFSELDALVKKDAKHNEFAARDDQPSASNLARRHHRRAGICQTDRQPKRA
jgi:hypothetical protein